MGYSRMRRLGINQNWLTRDWFERHVQDLVSKGARFSPHYHMHVLYSSSGEVLGGALFERDRHGATQYVKGYIHS